MKYNDFELLNLIHESNEEALEILYNKYLPIIIKKSQDAILILSHHGIEINDIMQEGFIGLGKAIKDFDDKDDTSFYTFALLCIDRQISNFIKKNLTIKSKVLNEATQIDNYIESTVSNNINMEESVINNNIYKEIMDKIPSFLTEIEMKVFTLKIANYKAEEIAKILNKDIKAIYNIMHRVRNKIKRNIDIDF